MRGRPLSLRARLVAAFVGIAILTSLVAAILTSAGLHRSFDDYVDRRSDDAVGTAIGLAEAVYSDGGGRWSRSGLDRLSHELALTGYHYRLRSRGRTLFDTTRPRTGDRPFARVAEGRVRGGRAGRTVGTLEVYALGARGGTSADDDLRGRLDRAHVVAAIIAGGLAIVAGLFVAARLSGPLRKLTTATKGLADDRDLALPAPAGSSEVRSLGDALHHLSQDLRRQRRARRQLAQDLSHEIRTPLMLLQARIEAMQDGVVPFDDSELSRLHTETLRLSRLVDQIERLAEAEAHPRVVQVQPTDLAELAREIHATLLVSFELRELRLVLADAPAHALADRDAVRQIVTNLLVNALKYTPSGTTVRLSTLEEGDRATLRVRDGGPGIPSVARRRVFDRLYRGSDAAAASAGAGLGLTIARELAEAQGGTLDLEDADEGSCFALRLPLARTQPGPPSPRPAWGSGLLKG